MVATPTKTKIEKADEDAFWQWCTDMAEWGAWMKGSRDLLLTPLCSGRFALQVEGDGAIALAVPESDVDAFCSVRWTSAALLRNHKDGDLLAVSADDAGVMDSEAGGAVPIRVFFPVGAEKMAAFDDAERPTTLRIRAMRVSRSGKPLVASGDPRAEVRLSCQNFKAAAKATA